jgi:FdhD protein
MHATTFTRGKGKFMLTEYVPTDERTGPRYPLLLTTGRILSQYNVGAQTRRTANVVWHEEDRLEIHPHDAEQRGVKDGDWVRIASRAGETALRALTTDRVAPGVVYTTFHQCHHHRLLGLGHQLPRVQGDRRAGEPVQRPHQLPGGVRRLRPLEPAYRAGRSGGVGTMADGAVPIRCIKVRASAAAAHARVVPAEVPVALVYDGSTHAVMMASPADLEDFALGFSLSEGIIATAAEISSLDVVRQDKGIEPRLWLAADRRRNLAERRRRIAGPTGCGLCGVEGLEAALPACPIVTSNVSVRSEEIAAALAALPPAQSLHQRTRAVHGAGFWTKAGGLVALAEDVGRHNALDKLIGRLYRERTDAGAGIVLLTSRVSVEMVQKAAMAGAPVLVAVSAPTLLAVQTAQRGGITLVAVARADGFEVFTHPHRIAGSDVQGDEYEIEHAA